MKINACDFMGRCGIIIAEADGINFVEGLMFGLYLTEVAERIFGEDDYAEVDLTKQVLARAFADTKETSIVSEDIRVLGTKAIFDDFFNKEA